MLKEGNRTLRALALTAASFAVVMALFALGALRGAEFTAYDFLSRHLNPLTPPQNVVVIKVDQQSLDALSAEGIRWPWPRQMYAPLVEVTSAAEAVMFDVLFTEPSSYGVQDDKIFARAVGLAGNVYLPVFLTGRERALSASESDFLDRISLPGAPRGLEFASAITPIAPLRSAVRGAGNVTISPDPDGVYRRVPLLFGLKGRTLPNFVLPHLLHRQGGGIEVRPEGVYSGGRAVEPPGGGGLLLRFFRQPFKSVSYSRVLAAYTGEGEGMKDFFRGKIVFVGLTAAGLYDLKPTAVSSIATGVDIHATAYENLANQNLIRPLGAPWAMALMLLISALVCSLVIRYHSAWVNLSVFLALLLGTGTLTAVLFRAGIYLMAMPPAVALVVSFIFSVAYSYATEGRERRFTRRAFTQYMDTRIVDYMLENPHLIKPGGKRMRVTVFFADLAGFTSIAEKVPAEEAARILHTVLNAFTDVIIEHGGVVDKYIGDAVMAFWGAPLPAEGDEGNACRAAQKCMAAIEEINAAYRAEGKPGISARVGVHTGDAIAGNLGSDRLFDYTVVGDTVNLASRLESANKFFGTRIIVSHETFENATGGFLVRKLGLLEVKGKSEPVGVYELMAEDGTGSGMDRDTVLKFNGALQGFLEKDFQGALDGFNEVLAAVPGDRAALLYAGRCEEFSHSEPEPGWDVIKLTEK